VSETSFVSITGTPFLYQAEAADTDGPNDIVSYSLDPTSADFDLLTIESDTGIVTLKSGLLDPTVKDTYSFTVVATDEAGNEATRAVQTTLSATTDVQGPGVIQQGGIVVTDTENTTLNGTLYYTLTLSLTDEAAADLSEGIQLVSLNFNYDASIFPEVFATDLRGPTYEITDSRGNVTTKDYFIGLFPTLTEGSINIEALVNVNADSTDIVPIPSNEWFLEIDLFPADVSADVQISFTDVIFNEGYAPGDTVINYGDPTVINGSDANESFVLSGGDVTVSGAGGIDIYVITETTGDTVFITDFDVENDGIDMSSLLLGLGYTGFADPSATETVDSLVTYYDSVDLSVLDLVAANSTELDNVFGAVAIDGITGVISGFYDANSAAGEVDIQTFELEVGNAVVQAILADPEDNGLLAALNGFIA